MERNFWANRASDVTIREEFGKILEFEVLIGVIRHTIEVMTAVKADKWETLGANIRSRFRTIWFRWWRHILRKPSRNYFPGRNLTRGCVRMGMTTTAFHFIPCIYILCTCIQGYASFASWPQDIVRFLNGFRMSNSLSWLFGCSATCMPLSF